MIKLSLPPSTNNIYGNRPGGKGRYLKDEGKSWKTDTGWIIKGLHRYWVRTANYRIEVELHLCRDRDIDGSLKLLLDAMTGIIYEDDRQVTELHVKKIKDKEPYLLLTIEQL